jgi:hypothetical protein
LVFPHRINQFLVLLSTTPNLRFSGVCYPWLRPYSSHKLDVRSKPCIFLGYSLSQNAYLCFDPTSTKIFISRHVKFVESVFPHKSLDHQLPRPDSTTIDSWVPSILHVSVPNPTLPVQHTPSTECLQELPSCAVSSSSFTPHGLQPIPPPLPTPPPNNPTSMHQTFQPTIPHRMITHSQNNIHKPQRKLNLHTQLNPNSITKPATVTQSLKIPHWRKAMSEEYDALVHNN